MAKTILTICSILLMATTFKAQNIPDGDKRSFDNLRPIKIDVDGDGRPDMIQPHIYNVPVRHRVKGKVFRQRDVQHWIALDLIASRGRSINSFFRYQYGNGEADYWVYALVSAGDINSDGKTDLIFYSGDDSSDETITLINRGNRFIVHKRKLADHQ